jgi:hypothetical protein
VRVKAEIYFEQLRPHRRPHRRRASTRLSMHHVSNHSFPVTPFSCRHHQHLLPSLSRAPFSFLLSCSLAPCQRAIQRSGINSVNPLPFFLVFLYSCRLRLPIDRRHPPGSRSRALFPLSLLPLDTSDSCPVLPFFLIVCGPRQSARKF